MYATNKHEHRKMTEAAYLSFEAGIDHKHEYRQGTVYAMSGGSVRHGIITVNVSTQLNVQLAEQACSVSSPDTRVHIANREAYRYPDVTVFCGDPDYVEGRTDTITNPIVLVEILYLSTALKDYNEKLEEYTQIKTLQAYLLVAQDEAKVERFMRQATGQWLCSVVKSLSDTISLPFLGVTMPLSKIYQKVTFD